MLRGTTGARGSYKRRKKIHEEIQVGDFHEHNGEARLLSPFVARIPRDVEVQTQSRQGREWIFYQRCPTNIKSHPINHSRPS